MAPSLSPCRPRIQSRKNVGVQVSHSGDLWKQFWAMFSFSCSALSNTCSHPIWGWWLCVNFCQCGCYMWCNVGHMLLDIVAHVVHPVE
jgi:hypothetical protein